MHHVDSRQADEIRHRQMRRRAVAGARIVHLAGIGLAVRHELGHGLGRHRCGDHQDVVDVADVRDGREILQRVVRQLGVKRAGDGVARGGEDQCLAVGRRFRDEGGADGAAGAGAVLDDHAAPERGAELGIERARHDVLHAARGERHHDARHLLGLRDRCNERTQRKKELQTRHQSLISASYIATAWRMRSMLHHSSVWCAICGSPGPSTTVGAPA